jgi:hypothetical protein
VTLAGIYAALQAQRQAAGAANGARAADTVDAAGGR